MVASIRLAAGVEYDGANFSGWQRQKHHVQTVQESVERALSRVANHPITVMCAGRTDTGVHGVGQVIHFETTAVREAYNWILGANANLPKGVALRWVKEVHPEFHARFSARWREYVYLISNTRFRPALMRDQMTWVHQPLDAERMHEAAQNLVGEHDFNAFRAQACQSKTSVRTMYFCSVKRLSESVILHVRANAFLYHMVRNIAGSLIQVGRGDASPEWIETVLQGKKREEAGITAPPDGLHFAAVGYPEEFEIPPPAPSFPLNWLMMEP